jgi:hypothetical protein
MVHLLTKIVLQQDLFAGLAGEQSRAPIFRFGVRLSSRFAGPLCFRLDELQRTNQHASGHNREHMPAVEFDLFGVPLRASFVCDVAGHLNDA